MEREAKLLCTVLKDEILATKAKIVFRPDSGDMMVNIPLLLKLQEEAFGYTMTEEGYKQINTVGVIQGDGIDRAIISEVLEMVTEKLGYSADVVIFGSGGALLQKVNRDTLKFAQKACAILVDNKWVGISKDPVTDPGKASKEGVLTLVHDSVSGKLRPKRLDQGYNEIDFAGVRANVA